MTRPDPTVGILVGGLVLTERRRWPALVLAACGVIAFSGAVHGQLLLHGIGLAAGVGFDACVVAWFVQRTNEPPFDLNRVAHMSTLILAAILVPSAGGILGAAALFLGGAPSFLVTWRAWWLAETLGILLTAPIALAAFPKGTRHLGTLGFWKVFEATITFAGAVVVAEIVFGEVLGPQVLVPAFVIPFLLWPVVRLGPGGTAAMLITVSFIGLWHAVQGQGPFAVVAGAPTILILRSQ